MSSERAYIQGLEKVRDELEARIKELEETLWVGYHCSPKCVCRGREKELEAENATLVDQHNRASHGTASHEALAYDAQERRIQELEEFIAERSGDASLVGRIKELEAALEEVKYFLNQIHNETLGPLFGAANYKHRADEVSDIARRALEGGTDG